MEIKHQNTISPPTYLGHSIFKGKKKKNPLNLPKIDELPLFLFTINPKVKLSKQN